MIPSPQRMAYAAGLYIITIIIQCLYIAPHNATAWIGIQMMLHPDHPMILDAHIHPYMPWIYAPIRWVSWGCADPRTTIAMGVYIPYIIAAIGALYPHPTHRDTDERFLWITPLILWGIPGIYDQPWWLVTISLYPWIRHWGTTQVRILCIPYLWAILAAVPSTTMGGILWPTHAWYTRAIYTGIALALCVPYPRRYGWTNRIHPAQAAGCLGPWIYPTASIDSIMPLLWIWAMRLHKDTPILTINIPAYIAAGVGVMCLNTTWTPITWTFTHPQHPIQRVVDGLPYHTEVAMIAAPEAWSYISALYTPIRYSGTLPSPWWNPSTPYDRYTVDSLNTFVHDIEKKCPSDIVFYDHGDFIKGMDASPELRQFALWLNKNYTVDPSIPLDLATTTTLMYRSGNCHPFAAITPMTGNNYFH